MTLEQGAYIATITQAVLVIISLAFVAYQLQQNVVLAKAANSQHLTEQAGSFNALLYENPELAELWYSYGKDLEGADRITKLRYREMLVQWMILHENIFYQHNRKLLDKDLYSSWRKDFEYTINEHNLSLISDDISPVFPGKFGKEVNQLLAKKPQGESK